MKKINLSIPNPCHESWEKMTAIDKGRFCQSCQKEVVNFSLMSDAQILSFFNKNKGRTCGRFRQDQLDRNILYPKPKSQSILKAAAISAGLIASSSAVSQVCPPHSKSVQTEMKHKIGEIAPTIASNEKSVQIQGLVRDATNDEPIIFANVLIKFENSNEHKGTMTDIDGKFNIEIDSSEKNRAMIEVQYVGYETTNVIVDLHKVPRLVEIKLEESLMMGDMMIVGIIVKETPLAKTKRIARTTASNLVYHVVEWLKNINWDWGKSSVQDDTEIIEIEAKKNDNLVNHDPSALLVYPNPASQYLHIRTTFESSNALHIHMINQHGQLVLRQKLMDSFEKIDIQSLSPGKYQLLIIDKHGKIQSKETIIILNSNHVP